MYHVFTFLSMHNNKPRHIWKRETCVTHGLLAKKVNTYTFYSTTTAALAWQTPYDRKQTVDETCQ